MSFISYQKIEELKKISLCKSDSSRDFFNSLIYYRTLKRYKKAITASSLLGFGCLTKEELDNRSGEILCFTAMCCYAKDYDVVFAAKKTRKSESGKYQFSDGDGYFDFVFQNATYIKIKMVYRHPLHHPSPLSYREKETIIFEKICDSATTVISDFTYDNPLFNSQTSEAILFIETDADTIKSKVMIINIEARETMAQIVTPPHYSIYVPSAKGYFVYGDEDTRFIEEKDIVSSH